MQHMSRCYTAALLQPRLTGTIKVLLSALDIGVVTNAAFMRQARVEASESSPIGRVTTAPCEPLHGVLLSIALITPADDANPTWRTFAAGLVQFSRGALMRS